MIGIGSGAKKGDRDIPNLDVFQLALVHALVEGPYNRPRVHPAVPVESKMALDAALCTYVPEPVQSLLFDVCCGPESLEGKHICTLLNLCF